MKLPLSFIPQSVVSLMSRAIALTTLSAVSTSLVLSSPGVAAKPVVQFKPPSPPDNGAPGTNVGESASRTSCAATTIPLKALVPSMTAEAIPETDQPLSNLEDFLTQAEAQVWGQTSKAHPKLWFYVPEIEAEPQLEFILQSADENELYRTDVPTPNESGIISVSIKPNYPLKTGQLYKWFLKARVPCSVTASEPADTTNQATEATGESKMATYEVRGWIKRVETAPSSSGTLQQQVTAAAEQGIWFDALTPLAQFQASKTLSPSDQAFVETNWLYFLETAGLEGIADEIVID